MVQFGGDTQRRRTQADDDARRAAGTEHDPTSHSSTTRRTRTSSGRCGNRASARPRTSRASATPGRDGRIPRWPRTSRRLPARPAVAVRRVRLLAGSLYGHFGQGCVHSRIPFDLFTAGHRAVPRLRGARRRPGRVVRRLALGRARRRPGAGELLARMFGERVRRLRRAEGDLRPGRPHESRQGRRPRARPESPPRAATRRRRRRDLYFSTPPTEEASPRRRYRCVGVGKCRSTHEGGA